MNQIIRCSCSYGIINNIPVRIAYSNEKGWKFISNDPNFINYGFVCKKGYYGDDIYMKYISEKQGISAYRLNTFCRYKGGVYEINNIWKGKVILFPNLETKKLLGWYINDDNSVDINYEQFMLEVEEIWEEREPIDGFVFDVEPIFYLKSKSPQ